ncbi:MAG: hypothetical protein LBS59_08800 [Puniceicoccales bacterium]|jgi:WD40 repeat protein|nr:hypothetical protein [Puniceicoccales bacterium]
MKFPKFELTYVRPDGTREAPKIVPVTKLPTDMKTSRRGFFGAAMLASAAVLAGCNTATGKNKKRSPLSGGICGGKRAHKKRITALAFSRDGKFLLSSGEDNTVKSWLVAARAHRGTLLSNKGRNTIALAFDAEGKTFFNGEEHRVEQFSFSKAEPVGNTVKPPLGYNSTLTALAAGNAAKNAFLQSVREYLQKARSISVSDNNEILAAVVDNDLKLWYSDAKGLNLLYEQKNVNLLAVSPDGKLMVCRDTKNTLLLYTVTRQEVRRQGGASTVLSFRRPQVYFLREIKPDAGVATALAFSPDGKILAIGYLDGTLVFWSIPDGQHLGCLMDIAASTDEVKGTTFSMRSETGQIIVYTLPCGSPIPANTVCTCNCVPGSVGTHACRCNTVTVCRCNTVPVCTCEAVRTRNTCSCMSVGTGRWICTCQAVRCR